MQNIQTQSKRAEFEKLVRITKNIDEKDRLRAILTYNEGRDVRDIANINLNHFVDGCPKEKQKHSQQRIPRIDCT